MIICTQTHYRAERSKTAETWQGVNFVVEVENKRNYIKFELDHPNRWRSAAEIKDYLAWVITQVDLLEKELPCSPAKISK